MGKLVTAVVGAGPAGLFFCILGRLLHPGDTWVIRLFDKRTEYVRTHRLRMAPEPYRAMAADVDDPRVDELVDWLESERFTPEVNALEQRLSALAADLGVSTEQLEVGPDAVTLTDLRTRLTEDGTLQPGDRLTIVGADSVHSEVRELAAGDVAPERHTHEQLVRLQVRGPGLPDELGVIEQYRWSKLLGSLLDYRKNRNGFVEIDLFLARSEHRVVDALHANPKEPIELDQAVLDTFAAPLFERIVRQLQKGFGKGPCSVSLYSSFRLEHRVMPRMAFPRPESTVFLVGDAGISLPFFRGMAALATCTLALARVHADLATGVEIPEAIRRYEQAVNAVKRRELAIVAARARMVRLGRDFARVSAMLPFPIQKWWLTVDAEDTRPAQLTSGVLLNMAFAIPPAFLAFFAPLLDAHVWEPLGWLWLPALPLQMFGGVVYYAARTFEPPNRALGWVWRAQILWLLVTGLPITLFNSMILGHPAQPHATMSWWVLGMAFVVGLVWTDRTQRRLWERANLG